MKCSCTYCRQAPALLPSRKGHVSYDELVYGIVFRRMRIAVR